MTPTSPGTVRASIAPALVAPALASQGDAKLRELWAQYLEAVEADHAAYAVFKAARNREKSRPIRSAKDPSRPLWEMWNTVTNHVADVVRIIQDEKAEGLFGLGVKLVAQVYDNGRDGDYDHEDAIRSALGDIDRMMGTDFLAVFCKFCPDFKPDEAAL